MSWTLTVPSTAREHWDAAVDAAEATGQGHALPGVAEDVAAARAALKALGRRVKRPRIAGYATGHVLQEGEGDGWADSLSVSVHGPGPSEVPTVARPTIGGTGHQADVTPPSATWTASGATGAGSSISVIPFRP
jgi:hypothetical protein